MIIQGEYEMNDTQEYNGLHYTLREDGDVKVSNPDTEATLYLGRDEILHLLMELEGFESDNGVRQPDQALEDASEHLGRVMDALQDAGWTNSELQPVERLMKDVNGQRGDE